SVHALETRGSSKGTTGRKKRRRAELPAFSMRRDELLLSRRRLGLRRRCVGLRIVFRRCRAARRRGIAAAHAERRDGLLVELAGSIQAFGGLELLDRLLRLRAHLAVGVDVQLGLRLLDELRILRLGGSARGSGRAFRGLRSGRAAAGGYAAARARRRAAGRAALPFGAGLLLLTHR